VFPAIFMPKLDLGSLSLYSRRGECFILVNVIWLALIIKNNINKTL